MNPLLRGSSSLILSQLTTTNAYEEDEPGTTQQWTNKVHPEADRVWTEIVRLQNVINSLMRENETMQREKITSRRQFCEQWVAMRKTEEECTKAKQNLKQNSVTLTELKSTLENTEGELQVVKQKLNALSEWKRQTNCGERVVAVQLEQSPGGPANWKAVLQRIFLNSDPILQLMQLLAVLEDIVGTESTSTGANKATCTAYSHDWVAQTKTVVTELGQTNLSAPGAKRIKVVREDHSEWLQQERNFAEDVKKMKGTNRIAGDQLHLSGAMGSSSLRATPYINMDISRLRDAVPSLADLKMVHSILTNILHEVGPRAKMCSPTEQDDESVCSDYYDCFSGIDCEEHGILPSDTTVDSIRRHRQNDNCNANNFNQASYGSVTFRGLRPPVHSISLPLLGLAAAEEGFGLYEHALQFLHAQTQTDEIGLESGQQPVVDAAANCLISQSESRNHHHLCGRSSLANEICEMNMYQRHLNEKQAEIDELNAKVSVLKRRNKRLDFKIRGLRESLEEEKQKTKDPLPLSNIWFKLVTVVAVNLVVVKMLRTILGI